MRDSISRAFPRLPRAAILAAIALVLLTWAASDLVVGAARAVGQWAAGLGTLEWLPPAGTWRDISPADSRRRLWGAVDRFLAPGWTSIANGLETATVTLRRSPNPHTVDVFVVRVDPTAWRFRVWGRPDWSPDSVEALTEEAGLTFAVNAAYFADDGPIGLVVSDGVRRQRQAKSRAAHFLVPTVGAPRIVNQKRADVVDLDQGFQGFPSIMTAGRTFTYMRVGGRGFDVWKVDRRTAACVDRDGSIVFLATDTVTNGLSLDELATVLGGLGCEDAMAFDGGSSTGLALLLPDHRYVVDNLEPVPLIVGITPVVTPAR